MASKYNAAVHTTAPDINKTEWAILNHRSMKQKKPRTLNAHLSTRLFSHLF